MKYLIEKDPLTESLNKNSGFLLFLPSLEIIRSHNIILLPFQTHLTRIQRLVPLIGTSAFQTKMGFSKITMLRSVDEVNIPRSLYRAH